MHLNTYLSLTKAACKRHTQGLQRLYADLAGNVLVVAALSLPLVIGAVGLAVDVSSWQQSKRALQGAADSAVYSAVIAKAAGASTDRATEEASAVLSTYGLVNGAGGVTVTISNPPTSGNYTANTNAWEVKIARTQALRFASLFLSAAPTLNVRAVAKAGSSGSGCILALHPTANKAINVTNNGQIANPNCVVYSNSSASDSLFCYDNCLIKASTSVVGNISRVGSAARMTGAFNRTGQSAIADPYAAVDPGSAGSCTQTTAVTGTTTLSPGHYCGGFNLNGSKTLTLNPGVYFVDSKFYFTNGAKLNATSGVTIVLNSNFCIGLGDCAIGNGVGNNATVNITAPTTGPTAGVAIMGQRTGTSRYQEFANNSYINIQGALYFPNDTLGFADNSNMNSALCTQLVASKVTINNNANMSPNCTGTGVSAIGSGTGSGSSGMLE